MAEWFDKYDEPGKHQSKKNTKRWCKGIKGREHEVEILIPPNIPGYWRLPCRWLTWRENYWLCSHYGVCKKCGKQIYKVADEQCPDFTANSK